MNTTSTYGSAVERAERILSRRPAAPPVAQDEAGGGEAATRTPEPGGPTRRADALRGHFGQAVSGRGLLRGTAHGYVALAASVQALLDPVRQAWQQSLDEARQEQEERVARTQGAAAARREEADEKQGEQTLKKTAGGAAEAASTAGDAAGA